MRRLRPQTAVTPDGQLSEVMIDEVTRRVARAACAWRGRRQW